MRILDAYAVNCGATIDKPFIYKSFFPLPFEKYITFQAESPIESKNYSYWQDVLNIISPVLHQQNIKIVQIGIVKEKGYQKVVDIRGQTNQNQLAYVISRSSLHFGPDSFGIHLASGFDVPIVGLYSNSLSTVAGPHFGSKNKQTLFESYKRVGNQKPSYANQENPKSVNKIKPEEIANAIFTLLNINFKVPFETVHTGEKYSSNMIRELIPDNQATLSNPELPVEIRCDLFDNEELLVKQLQYLQKAILVINKPLNINVLKFFKPHIAMIVVKITETNLAAYVQELISLGFNLVLVSEMSEEDINKVKITYYTIGKVNKMIEPTKETIDTLRKDIDKLYYRSCKIVASNAKLFLSHASIPLGVEFKHDMEYQKVIDSPQFWKDLEFYTIIKKLD